MGTASRKLSLAGPEALSDERRTCVMTAPDLASLSRRDQRQTDGEEAAAAGERTVAASINDRRTTKKPRPPVNRTCSRTGA